MIQRVEKPSWLFDRESEWAALSGFVAGSRRGGLAIVRGRRRHGKSVLLRAAADAGGAFYYQAVRGLAVDQRRDLARAWNVRFGGPEPAFTSWADVADALLSPPGATAPAVILDELPYLTESSPELESVLQRALDARGPQQRSGLVLCGSARSVMTRLLVGSAPLRGRARLELDITPFGFRQAAAFADLPPDVAFPVHAVVGGVPGYATDLLDRIYPDGPGDVERWLVEVAASPTRPLVYEARSLIELESGVREPATYLSALSALAGGATRAGEIASLLGRSTDAIAHALATLDTLGLVARSEDMLRRGRPTWAIADPLLRFYSALLRPRWELVERADARRLAQALASPWRAQVLGPHLETLSRDWVLSHADPATTGGLALQAGAGTVADAAARVTHEVDVVVLGEQGRILAIGEAKLRAVGPDDRHRLTRIRDLLSARQGQDGPIRLLLFSATGFAPGTQADDTELVDLPRLYTGA